MRASAVVVLLASALVMSCKAISTGGVEVVDDSDPMVEDESQEADPVIHVEQEVEAEQDASQGWEDLPGVEEKWQCEDIKLTSICADSFCLGTVQTGNYPAELTTFSVNGVEREWAWSLSDDDTFDYIFVIDGGWGRYYDFRGVSVGESVKPRGVYECTEGWW